MITCDNHSLVCYEGGEAASLLGQWLGLGSAGQHVWCQSVIGVRQWSTTLVSAVVFSHFSSGRFPCFDRALQKLMTLYYIALLITTQRQELHQSLNCANKGTA
jgi:hypothetical protein